MRLAATALCFLLTIQGFPLAQEAGKVKKGAAPEAAGKAERLKELIKILESITDDDYDAAISEAPKTDEAASRPEALKSAYSTLASLEYREAAADAPKEEKYAQAQTRVAAPQETGWAVDLLKWLGNAAINYALVGGETYVGRSLKSPKAAALDKKVGHLRKEISSAEPGKKADKHFQLGEAYEELAAAAVAPQPEDVRIAAKEARLKRLVVMLRSLSDEDYLKMLPPERTKDAQSASRPAALKSTYVSLAALEYRLAALLTIKESADDYAKAYKRLAEKDAAAVGVEPETLKETGWAIDLLKWLGNAAINYALVGGETYVGRKLKDSESDKLDKLLAGLDSELAAADTQEKKAQIHFNAGTAYEALAALPSEAETTAQRSAHKKQRLDELTDLLQAVSDDEYKEALKALHGKADGRPELASREAVLKSAYVTLAALEYHDAGARSKAELKRLSQEDAKDVVVDPDTLQETGWASDLLGLATLGGVGYLIYQNQRHHSRQGHPLGWQARAPEGVSTPPAPPIPTICLDGTKVPAGGQCPVNYVKEPTTPPPSTGTVNACPESVGGCTGQGMPGPQPAFPTYGDPHSVLISLSATRDDLQKKLTVSGLTAEKDAELHSQLGSVYEQLAAAAVKPAAKPAEKPVEKPKPKPVEKPAPKPAPTPAPEPPASPEPSPEPAAPEVQPEVERPRAPTKEEILKHDMDEMDNLEKEMRRKVDSAPKPDRN